MSKRAHASSRVTLNQVARKAGVSVTTASMVLAGKAEENRISGDTLARVKQAAADLDYSPNLLVKSLQRGHTQILAFFSGFRNRSANDLYMDRLTTALQIAVGQRGYNLLVCCDFSLSPDDTYRFINGGHSDGLLLFAPRPDDPLLPMLRASRQPIVLINARDEQRVLPSVKDDVHDGMRQVADALLRLGHRRVVAVTERDRSFRDAPERIALLRAFLGEHGVEVPDTSVIHFPDNADAMLRALFSAPDPPTAVFCWRDRVAYWVLEACERMGLDVPGQLSVVGYDGLHWPAATRHVAASVCVDPLALAESAVNLLDRYIRGHEGNLLEQATPVALTPGTTLGPPGRC